jgi:hypothetical protein
MRWILLFCVTWSASVFADDRSILLVTPKGVWQADVTDGVPGPFRPAPYDVIVQGFDTPGGGGDTPAPKPPESDPIVNAVKAATIATLNGKNEATAAAAIVDALAKNGLSGEPLKEALDLGLKIADTSLKAEGRLIKWGQAVVKITTDPVKISAGASAAFGTTTAELQAIHQSVVAGEATATAEAMDFTQIIQIIMMIIELLKNLGII